MPTVACAAPLQPWIRTSLYTDKSNPKDPSRRISDEEWQRFVDAVLLPHFPTGGTIYENSGWWRRPNGSRGGGQGRTLVMLAPASQIQLHRAAVRAVIDSVKQRYSHQSVGWEEGWACVAF